MVILNSLFLHQDSIMWHQNFQKTQQNGTHFYGGGIGNLLLKMYALSTCKNYKIKILLKLLYFMDMLCIDLSTIDSSLFTFY